MGPRVTPDTLKALHWYRANHVVTVRNREAVYKYSNENYPIFIRECWFTDSKGNRADVQIFFGYHFIGFHNLK